MGCGGIYGPDLSIGAFGGRGLWRDANEVVGFTGKKTLEMELPGL